MFKSLAVLLSVAVVTVSAESCFDADTDYYGNDIGKDTSVTDAAGCQQVCQATKGCLFWTFYDNPGHAAFGCHIKNKKATPTQLPKGTSGPRICDNGECLRSGIGNAARSFSRQAVSDPTACTELCRGESKCVSFSYNTKTGLCYLKDKAAVFDNTPAATAGNIANCKVAEGLGLGTRCNSKSPPCKEANSACITYRCKCVQDWVRYPRNGDACVAQNTLELDTPCTNPGSACSASNSECRAYRCMCKHGFSKSASGDECE